MKTLSILIGFLIVSGCTTIKKIEMDDVIYECHILCKQSKNATDDKSVAST